LGANEGILTPTTPANNRKIMIRHAKVEDASAIAAIHVQAWQIAFAGIVPPDYLTGLSVQEKTEFWEQQLAVNLGVVLVSVRNGKLVGWASGGASRDADAKGGFEIYAIYVAPHYWRQGIGRELMKAVEDALSPCSGITLWVLRENQPAIGFYRRLGYKFDGAEKSVLLGGANLSEVRLENAVSCQAPPQTATGL
jgi:ribosomal protein S18 acetylase RimI-like enzyme